MKKCILSILLILSMLNPGNFVFAENASGLKDVESVAGKEDIVIETPELAFVWCVPDVWRYDDFPYSVSIHSGSKKTEYYTVRAFCGDKRFDDIEIAVPSGTTIKRDGKMSGLLRGKHIIKIEVVSSDGSIVDSFNKTVHILPPLVDSFLAPYTRRIGMAGALAVSESDDVAQLTTQRLEFTWAFSEQEKGKYNIMFGPDMEEAKRRGNQIVALLDYNNPIYSGDPSINRGTDTKENIDAFAKYATAVQNTYKDGYPIEYFEIWNEPNGMWHPRNTTDYAYLAEVSKRELMKLNPREKTGIGVVAMADYSFVEETLLAGLYPNMDAAVNHPYIQPTKVDIGYHNVLSNMTKVLTRHGGWKEQIITEVGWATHTAGVSVEQAAIELAKQVPVADYYDIPINQYFRNSNDFNWNGYTVDGIEANFGVFYHPNDSEFKPSAYSISQLNNMTIGAVFCGKLEFDDKNIEAYLYARDGKLFTMIWSKGNETEVSFDGENLTAVDMNGNYIGSGSKFKIAEAPIYISGLSRKNLTKNIAPAIRAYLDLYIDTTFEDDLNKKGFDKAKEVLYKTVDMAEEFYKKSSLPTEEEALEGFRNHIAVNKTLIDMYASGELEVSKQTLNGLLYINQWGANVWSAVYMLAVNPNNFGDYQLQGDAEIEKTHNIMKERAGENTLSWSDSILIYAEKFAEKANGVQSEKKSNPMKYGAVKAWDEMAVLLAKTAGEFALAEPIGYDNVIMQLPSTQCVVEIGAESAIDVSLYNYREKETVSGYIELADPDGEVIAKTDSFSLKAGESAKYTINTILTTLKEGDYMLRLVENGEVIIERKANLKGDIVFEATLENAESVFDKLKTVKVSFTELKGRSFKGAITVNPLCDWILENAVDNEVSVSGNGTQTFEWNIASKESKRYHAYPFEIIVKNEKGEEVIHETQMLNFLVIKDATEEMDVEDFDGDITFFEDAYPVYAETPENPLEREQWHDGDYYTRMLAKWSNEALYLQFDVFDWQHENAQVGAMIWNGDSIQLGIDPLNNDGGEDTFYQSDDFEFGIAFTDSGVKNYAWQDAVTNVASEKPSEWGQVILNREIGMTRYFYKIPKSAISNLVLSEGTEFGFNTCYNNSNLGARANYVQFTPGVADGKKPYLYWDFTLIKDDMKINDTAEAVIEEKIEANNERGFGNVERELFNDIKKHWAKPQIELAARRGYVSGKGDRVFSPDTYVTRCEMAVMFTGVTGGRAEPQGHIYKDVWGGLWHASSVNGALIAGFIPDGMADEYFYPEKNTTREETFAMMDRLYTHLVSDGGEITKSIDNFADASEISENYKDAVERMYNLGIVSGTDENMLLPQNSVTRAEAVSLLMRIMAKVEEAK